MSIDKLKEIVALAGDGYSEKKTNNGKKAYIPKKDAEENYLPITDNVLLAHIESRQPIGINMNVGDEKSHFAVFDFDDHEGKHDEDVMRVRVGYVAAALTNAGVPYFVVRSGGGKGYHIWLTFEKARRADTLRDLMREYLDAANKLLRNSPWPEEKFLPDTAEGKGMFVDTGKLFQRDSRGKSDFTYIEHYIELLPKGGKFPVIALPLALESIVLTPTEIDDYGCMQFEEGGDISIEKIKKSKPGPRGGQRSNSEVDEAAALKCYLKAYPGGSYKQWTNAAFHICGAFGERGREMFIAYSKETDGFESEDDVTKKWENIAAHCSPNGNAFWSYARAGGYKGGLPDDLDIGARDVPKLILQDIVGSLDLFLDRDGNAFAQVGLRRVMSVQSQEFGDYIRRTAHESGVIASADMVRGMQDLARANAYDTRRDVHLRVAQVKDAIYVDLCDDDDRIIRITSKELRVFEGNDTCDVAFRRSGQKPLVYDESGTVDDIRKMLNVSDDQFVVFMACAVKMFFPDTPSPIVNITGEHGASKTSATWVMRSLIDPVTAMSSNCQKVKDDDLLIRAWHNAVLTLENVSDLSKISDTLCGICTGMGFETRQFYTNGDLFSIYVKRPVIVNGIDPTKYAADLISRMVGIELRAAEKPMRESVFLEMLHAQAPRMFFAMVALVREVLSLLPSIDPDKYAGRGVRLADFAAIGEATARILGKEADWFVNQMAQQLSDAQLDAAMDNAVFTAMGVWGTDNECQEIRITPAALLQHLLDVARDNDLGAHRMPQTPSRLSKELKSIAPILRKRGWCIEKDGRNWFIKAPRASDTFLEIVAANAQRNDDRTPF